MVPNTPMTPLQAISEFGTNFAKNANQAIQRKNSFVVVEEQNLSNGDSNSRNINLKVVNGGLIPLFLVLGTPVGIPDEATALGAFPASIGAIANLPANAQSVTDNAGVGATYITLLNKRFVRQPQYFNYMEVVTDSTAQRSQQLIGLSVPLNAFSDSAKKDQVYNAVYTEYNGVILGSGFVLGEFAGIAYPILPGVTANINLCVGARTALNMMKA